MIKVSSSFILGEFAKIINETIEHFKERGQIKTHKQKNIFKFEATALVFWLFQKTDMFPELYHKLLLDEVHNQYFDRLRKHGYDFKMRQLVCDDFNLRYKTYNEVFNSDQDLSRIGVKFIDVLSKRSKAEIDIKDIMIPLFLMEKLKSKFKEWRKVIKS